MKWLLFPLALVAGLCYLFAADAAPKELLFTPVKIDGPVHDPAHHTYWFGPFAECSSVLDINGDGKLDIAAGHNYYLAPNWTKRSDYRDGAATNGPDIDDNYEGTMDVNNDGRMDVISSGWMLKQGIYWYENPGKPDAKWTSHALHEADGLEGMVIGNLAGHDGKDVLVNYYAKRPGRGLIWYEHINKAPWFVEHKLGPEGVGVSHGSGIGDINGDGRPDVVTTSGWFEAPKNPSTEQWTWHPDYQFTAFGADGRPGGAGLPILITDANGDGLADIIIGSDHGYGLAWFEQKMVNGKRTFVKHWIETEYPTFHTMALADLDGDGKPELITGKQMLAHNGGDVGTLEPTFVFYYKFDKGNFERHILSYSNIEPYFAPNYSGPPPTDVVGVGMRISVGDMDGDGRQDIVIACRSGLYVFFNKGPMPRSRPPRNLLPERDSYPGNFNWDKPQAMSAQFQTLFNGRDLAGWQPASNWVVENGEITLKNRTDRQEHNDNYLYTEKKYGDFVLELDFKVGEQTNSGVFLRTSDPKDPVQTGLEIQVATLAQGRPLGKGSVGGIYDMVAPSSNALKLDDWNHYIITAKGSHITVVLNDIKVSEADLNQWSELGKGPDGTPNKFNRAVKDFARTGYVGLQDHGSPVWYRNIRIKSLDSGTSR